MAPIRLHKLLIDFFLSLILLSVICFGSFVAWVITGPRSLDDFTPHVEAALAPSGSNYKVRIKSSLLVWGGWKHPVDIQVRDVDVIDRDNAIVAHFPEVSIRLYVYKLLIGKVELKSIELLSPVVRLAQDKNGNITSFGFTSGGAASNAPISAALVLLTSGAGDNPITHLKSFIISHATLSVEDSQGHAFLSSPDAAIEITRRHGIASGRLVMPLTFDNKHSEIDTSFTINGASRTVVSDVALNNIPSEILHALAPTQQWIDRVHVPISARANIASDFDANITGMNFMLEAGAGTIDFSGQLEHALQPQGIRIAGLLEDHLNTLTIKEGMLDFGKFSLTFSGTAHRQGDDYGVDGEAETRDIPVNDMHDYWPLKLAPHSRHWVTTRISKGKIVKASIIAHFKPGDFKLKDTPDADVDANIELKGVTVAYKPGHPAITDADGTVRFTGETMDAKITGARYLSGTRITSARARFPDFVPDDVKMTIEADLDTTAKDIQTFLALPELKKTARLNLTPQITGRAKGSVRLDFIAFSENEKNDVSATGDINYAVKAALSDVSQNGFMGKYDVANADMNISVDNKGVKATGKATLSKVPMTIDLSTSFAGKGETKYEVKADMPVARLPDFDLPKIAFAKGTMGVKATISSSDDSEKADATLDLTHTEISLPQHGFFKKTGDKATLKLTTDRLPSGNTLISSFALEGDHLSLSGKAEYDKKVNDFTSFSFSPMRMGKHNLESLDYQKSGNTVHLAAKGDAFDATPYLSDSSGRNMDLGYVIDMQVGRLILGEGREMNAVAVEADCPADECRSASIHAKLKDGTPFVYSISNGNLEASCANAGELVRDLTVFDTIQGGVMSMKGQYNAGKLEGKLEVKDYTIKNAPMLTKIFTIASLTGLLDTLSGKGIYFERLSAPFEYHRGIIVLKDAKAHGSAIGITADGVVDMSKSTVDLNGVVIPSYTLNSLVGNIPLLGNLLMGGKGKGLLALNYSMHGDMKDPAVTVNPLSVLTPGFLRNIFDIFDKPAPDLDAIEKAQKQSQSKQAPASLPQPATEENQ